MPTIHPYFAHREPDRPWDDHDPYVSKRNVACYYCHWYASFASEPEAEAAAQEHRALRRPDSGWGIHDPNAPRTVCRPYVSLAHDYRDGVPLFVIGCNMHPGEDTVYSDPADAERAAIAHWWRYH